MSARVPLSLVVLWSVGPAWPAREPIAGSSAGRWVPQQAWVQTQPERCGVEPRDGHLVFTVRGRGAEMPFQITLRPEEMDGDSRYLLVRYRANGLSAARGNYFLHGWEGTPGGLTYADGDEAATDGSWHTIAVDLVAVRAREPTRQLALKVIVGDGGEGVVEVERCWFADELPAGTLVSRTAQRPAPPVVTVTWPAVTAEPQVGWTPTPAKDHHVALDGETAAFRVGDGGMRWRVALPRPAELRALPCLTVRYRAIGAVGARTYAIWLGDRAAGSGGHSLIALPSGSLRADGRWHRFETRLAADWTATHLAVGLDSDGGAATLELGPVTFSVESLKEPLARMLPYQTLPAPWPAGRDGWTPLPPATGGRGGARLPDQLGLADWFTSDAVTVRGVPFTVATDPTRVQRTGTTDLDELTLPLPPGTRELYLLTAVAAPADEPFGIDWRHPRPMEVLDVPEKLVCEIRYETGPPDQVLPVMTTGGWGVPRGVEVVVVHPDPTRRPTTLIWHDCMRTASFGILAATARFDAPRVSEPNWDGLNWPAPPQPKLPAEPWRQALDGTRWATPPADSPVTWAPGPVFEVAVGGQVLPAEEWRPGVVTSDAPRLTAVAVHQPTGLSVELRALPAGARLRLELTVRNGGSERLAATVRFPVLSGVRIGTVADTWYLFGKRGGLIHRAPLRLREPLGERHPLQCDGFFNPATGVALACLTTDTVGAHHFVDEAKDEGGGSWSPEYPERDLPPGASFAATPAELHLLPGDWRAIFGAYRRWLAGWYTPPKDKDWWRRSFATIGRNARYDAVPDPRDRGSLAPTIERCRQAMGYCDLVHLFGWSATKEYGDWGDYGHYEQTVGGLATFRAKIAAAQAQGVAVSLYQDAYLLCEKSRFAGAKARQWAMRRRDGEPWYVPVYEAFNICPYQPGWQDYLSAAYGRIAAETGVKVLYIDEYGATDGRWTCYAKDHGHNGVEIPSLGEVAMLRRIRAAVGPDVALYTEYPPAEASRLYLDGSLTYQAVWSVDQAALTPHFIDLPRFAFPEFKQFHLIHYVAVRDGNGWVLKFPFFNGETYRLGEPNLPSYDEAAMALQRRAVQVLCEHREAFASREVEPLVPTAVSGVFANRFTAPRETVWTLYNANGRTVRGVILRVPHLPGATYHNAWSPAALTPAVADGVAAVALELGPQAVGCLVQTKP